MEKLHDELTPEMIPQKYRAYAKDRGMDEVCALSDHFGGQKIYIPKPDTLTKEHVRLRIIMDYENGGYTHQDLANKYDVDPKTVGRYLRKAKTQKPI